MISYMIHPLKRLYFWSVNLSVKVVRKSKLWERVCCLIKCHFFLCNNSQTDEKPLSSLGWPLLQPEQPRNRCPKGHMWLQQAEEPKFKGGSVQWGLTQCSATAFVLKVPHHFWSGTIPNCPGRLMICNWFIGLLTPETPLDTLTTQLLIKAASIPHQDLKVSQQSTTKFCSKIPYLLLSSALLRATFRQVHVFLSSSF